MILGVQASPKCEKYQEKGLRKLAVLLLPKKYLRERFFEISGSISGSVWSPGGYQIGGEGTPIMKTRFRCPRGGFGGPFGGHFDVISRSFWEGSWSFLGGFPKNSRLILQGFSRDFLRVLLGFCRVLLGFSRNSLRILPGFSSDSLGIIQEFAMAPLEVL